MTDQRLWIAIHLLYPNSSQASDVYNTILLSLPKKNSGTYAKDVFLKLESFFLKNAAVRSGQPFNIFEDYKLDSWNTLYQKSMKKHLLVIVGLIVFGLTINEVATFLKISDQKARFLVNQAFKKLTFLAVKDPMVEIEFKYKKIQDIKISYFYTNENLVEFSLDLLSEKDAALVSQGLVLHPQLRTLEKKYGEIIQELRHLVKAKLGPIEINQSINRERIPMARSVAIPKLRRSLLAVGTVSVIFLGFILIRPVTVKFFPTKLGGNSVKMMEVNSQPYLAENSVPSEDLNSVNLKEMPVNDRSKPPLEKPKVAVTPKVVAVASKQIDVPTAPKETASSKQGGLYRASIQVSDLDTLTGRITDRLVALGGKKAGEVELGWKKTTKVSYYHIILPTENIEEAKLFLNKFGQLNIQFEPHPRLMPAGQKRMILEVKESE